MTIPHEMIEGLHRLNRAQKWQMMQIIMNDLAVEEGSAPVMEYEVWSPQDEGNVVSSLEKLLEEAKNKNG
jgi:hypothetical protein